MTQTWKLSRLAALLVAAMVLSSAGCNRDPNYAKQQYLKSGNKYFERGRYKEALIMYRKALAKDQKYGEAYYRMALVMEKTGESSSLVPVLRRATALLPQGTPEYNDAALKLGEILTQAAMAQSKAGQNKALMDEVGQLQSALDRKAPSSFEDYRLKADVKRAEAAEEFVAGQRAESKTAIDESVADLRKALAAKPADQGTAMALARTLEIDGQVPEAKQIYTKLIDQNKSLAAAYFELYRIDMALHKTDEAGIVMKRGVEANPKNFQFRTMLAAYYFDIRDKADMAKVLDGMEGDPKGFPDAYMTAGDFYLRIGDMDSALSQYRTGEQKDPKRKIDYGKRIVDVLVRQGKRDDAYNKALELVKENPKDTDALALKAEFQLDRGQVAEAESELQQAVTAKPDNVMARFNLGRAHLAKGETQQAIQAFEECVRERPQFLRARLALAESQLSVGQNEAALKSAQDALQIAPENSAGQVLEARALGRTGQTPKAREVIQGLLAKQPNFAEAHLEMGAIDLGMRDYPAARAEFEKTNEINSGDPRAIIGVADTWLGMKQPEKAIEYLAQQADAHPDRPDLRMALAGMRARLGQMDQALGDYNSLLTKYKLDGPGAARVQAAIGELYQKRGDYSSSASWFEKAEKTWGAPNPVILFSLAQADDRLGKHEEAWKLYDQVLGLKPDSVEAMNNLAYSYAQQGTHLNEALTLANRAKQQAPNSPDISDTLAFIYLKRGLTAQSLEVYKQIVQAQPDNPTFHFHYCLALDQTGDKVAAQKECALAEAKHLGGDEAKTLAQVMAKLR